MDPSPQELKLTPDLLEYARAVALKEAPNHCGRRVDYEDVAQESILHLLSRPPKFDPSRGSEKTLIYTIVKRAVIRFADREAKQARKFRPFPQAVGAAQDAEDHDPPENQISESRTKVLTRSRWNMDDILKYIDNQESRDLCRLVIECKGNLSDAARRLNLSEGTVRYRLKLLGPKLIAAGFDPFSQGGVT